MKRRCFGWLAAVALAFVPWMGTADAAIVPLSDLLVEGSTIQSGDKIFSDFNYLRTGDMPMPENVNVETIQDENGDYGIRVQGGFVDQPGGDASDVVLIFNVTVAADSAEAINGVTLSSNPAVFNGPGLASITETFLPVIGDDKLVVFDMGEGNQKLIDSITFADNQTFTTLPVQKDVILFATSESGAVTMSFFDQTFSQIPEPSSLSLALAGLLGLMSCCRKRS